MIFVALMVFSAVPANAAAPIETMPLWHLQVRITTGNTAAAGTDGTPALRFNSTTSGVRTLNPPSKSAFDAGHVDSYDLRLFGSPSEITMLRIGIAGNDDWCVKRVELWFNGRVAFAQDAVPGGACASIKAGTYLQYSSAELRANPAWTGYGTPPPLPTRMTVTDLRALVTSVSGSAMLSSAGVYWDPAVALTVTRKTPTSIGVSFGIRIVDPSGIESSFTAKVTYDAQLFVGTDGKLHVRKTNALCGIIVTPNGCYQYDMSNAVIAQLDTALSRMTATSPPPHYPLRFGVDAYATITWSRPPVIGP